MLVAIGSFPFIKVQWLFAKEAFVQRETMLLCSNRRRVSSRRREERVGLSLQSPLVEFFSIHCFFYLLKEWLPPAHGGRLLMHLMTACCGFQGPWELTGLLLACIPSSIHWPFRSGCLLQQFLWVGLDPLLLLCVLRQPQATKQSLPQAPLIVGLLLQHQPLGRI